MKHSVDIKHLKNLYESGMTTRQIGSLVSVPPRTVARYLKNAGVNMRWQGYAPIERLQDAAWLRDAYIAKGMSTTEIAKSINCSNRAVSHWLRQHGIGARPTGSKAGHSRNSSEESRERSSVAKRGKFIGPENPNWKGGIIWKDPDRGRYPYKKWASAVKARDGQCMECGSTDQLHAHHIKRWQDYPALRYDVNNGVTLCYSCHEKAHGRGFKFRWPKQAKMPTSAQAR